MYFRSKLCMPQYLSHEAQNLLRALFKRSPTNRLGSSSNEAEEFKSHPFFASIDFELLVKKQVPPPFIPALVANPLDLGNLKSDSLPPGKIVAIC